MRRERSFNIQIELLAQVQQGGVFFSHPGEFFAIGIGFCGTFGIFRNNDLELYAEVI